MLFLSADYWHCTALFTNTSLDGGWGHFYKNNWHDINLNCNIVCQTWNIWKLGSPSFCQFNHGSFHEQRYGFIIVFFPFSHFLHAKTTTYNDFRCKKWDFQCPKLEKETTCWGCCRKYSVKMMVSALFVNNDITFGEFWQILEITYFRLIFSRFPLMKPLNQNPMVLSLKLRLWWVLLINVS